MSTPFLTPDQLARHIVVRRYRFASDETLALDDLLISMHPDSVREARDAETFLILMELFLEDPLDKFERLTGRTLQPRLSTHAR